MIGRIVNGKMQQVSGNVATPELPCGTIIPYYGSKPDITGWLPCDGSEFDSKQYPALYMLLNDNHTPDLRGRFLQGNDNPGTFIEAGLPNITGYIDMDVGGVKASQNTKGAFYKGTNFRGLYGSNVTTVYNIGFDASKSNSIYGNSDTVQPPALCVSYIIKY